MICTDCYNRNDPLANENTAGSDLQITDSVTLKPRPNDPESISKPISDSKANKFANKSTKCFHDPTTLTI